MALSLGECIFVAAPAILGAFLWQFPKTRRFRVRSLVIYAVVMSLLIWGALSVVAYIAGGRVSAPGSVLVVLWFTFAWRLAWRGWEPHRGLGGASGGQ